MSATRGETSTLTVLSFSDVLTPGTVVPSLVASFLIVCSARWRSLLTELSMPSWFVGIRILLSSRSLSVRVQCKGEYDLLLIAIASAKLKVSLLLECPIWDSAAYINYALLATTFGERQCKRTPSPNGETSFSVLLVSAFKLIVYNALETVHSTVTPYISPQQLATHGHVRQS